MCPSHFIREVRLLTKEWMGPMGWMGQEQNNVSQNVSQSFYQGGETFNQGVGHIILGHIIFHFENNFEMKNIFNFENNVSHPSHW